MDKPIISVKNLGKRYLLGAGSGERYRALRDVITNGVKNIFKRSGKKEDPREIWALKDVTFDVRPGEKIGIIGRNGAGKSTLLKLLSEITEPTEGTARIYGRVASLLEVGTGFHPELTGRENIFMNGAILGMKRAEIKKKFDEIAAFAEIEKFLDTPVKRYSSGMYVRLAFAVAAHLEPEILLVDEVLAVGDAQFQKKCMGKMEDISKGGRTILFVSHNMASIANFCQRTILLNSGRIEMDDCSQKVIQRYQEMGDALSGEVVWSDPRKAPGNDTVRLDAVRILQDGQDGATADVDISKDIMIEISYRNFIEGTQFFAEIVLKDRINTWILTSTNHRYVSLADDPWYGRPQPRGLFRAVCRIPGNFLNEGDYVVTVVIGKAVHDIQIMEDSIISFHVHDSGEMRKEGIYGPWGGVVRPKLAWSTKHLDGR